MLKIALASDLYARPRAVPTLYFGAKVQKKLPKLCLLGLGSLVTKTASSIPPETVFVVLFVCATQPKTPPPPSPRLSLRVSHHTLSKLRESSVPVVSDRNRHRNADTNTHRASQLTHSSFPPVTLSFAFTFTLLPTFPTSLLSFLNEQQPESACFRSLRPRAPQQV